VFFRRDIGLRFDESTFTSFHCHVEDLCMQAKQRGMPVIVPFADATHASEMPSPAWRADYMTYRARLASKWRGFRFVTT
jgi:metal-sulfur cluster biosynthetic enzyme